MSDARFTRAQRLSRPKEFQRVFQNPCKSVSAELAVLCERNALDYPRLGLAISRKHAPAAVARSRIKRLIRESFRQHQEALAGLDVVVLARPGVHGKSNAQLRRSLEQHWKVLAKRCKRR